MSKTHSDGPFPETRHSLMDRALRGDEEAMNELARKYESAIYGTIASRWQDQRGESAEDLVQEVLSQMCRPANVASWAQEERRYRAWVLAIVKHTLVNRWRKMNAAKRGGGTAHVAIDNAEGVTDGSPSIEEEFDLKYARSMLAAARARVRAKWESDGNADMFDRLIGAAMLGKHTEETHGDIAVEMGVTRAVVGGRVARLKEEFEQALYRECRDTCGSDEEAQKELRGMMVILFNAAKPKQPRSKD